MNNYTVFYFDNFIERYAAQLGKPVIYLRSTGWNASSDVDAINASYEVYKNILPIDVWTALKNSEHVFMESDDLIDDIVIWLNDNFPSSQESCVVPENYIYYALANSQGQIIENNE